jgi:hypothetical protein
MSENPSLEHGQPRLPAAACLVWCFGVAGSPGENSMREQETHPKLSVVISVYHERATVEQLHEDPKWLRTATRRPRVRQPLAGGLSLAVLSIGHIL